MMRWLLLLMMMMSGSSSSSELGIDSTEIRSYERRRWFEISKTAATRATRAGGSGGSGRRRRRQQHGRVRGHGVGPRKVRVGQRVVVVVLVVVNVEVAAISMLGAALADIDQQRRSS